MQYINTSSYTCRLDTPSKLQVQPASMLITAKTLHRNECRLVVVVVVGSQSTMSAFVGNACVDFAVCGFAVLPFTPQEAKQLKEMLMCSAGWMQIRTVLPSSNALRCYNVTLHVTADNFECNTSLHAKELSFFCLAYQTNTTLLLLFLIFLAHTHAYTHPYTYTEYRTSSMFQKSHWQNEYECMFASLHTYNFLCLLAAVKQFYDMHIHDHACRREIKNLLPFFPAKMTLEYFLVFTCSSLWCLTF